jgi:hypothetical protein
MEIDMGAKVLSGSITRPANTDAYAAGDVIGTAATQQITLTADQLREKSSGVILKAQVISTASPTALATLELWLLKAAVAAQADSAAFAITDAEIQAAVVATIALGNSRVGLASGNTVYESDSALYSFQLPDFRKDLIGILVVRNAYVPISGEVFTVNVSVDFD